MKNYNKDIISSYLMYLDANNLYGWAMSQKLPVNGFKWVEKLSKFNERFIKSYNENSDIGYFLEADINYPKELFNLYKDLPFLPERKKANKCEKRICIIEQKENYLKKKIIKTENMEKNRYRNMSEEKNQRLK